MPLPRDTLTPDALAMIDAIDRYGSFAAAARALGQVRSEEHTSELQSH